MIPKSTLQTEVFYVIGESAAWKVNRAAHLVRFFWAWGLLVGLAAGIAARDGFVLIIVGAITAAACYILAERYLLDLDHRFFTSTGNSKREVFDRHFAQQVSFDLGLRMSEPAIQGLSKDEARAVFAARLDEELKRQFREFDWRFFVREVVKYSR